MRTFLKAAAAAAALAGLGGCATGFPAEVSRYQAMPAPQGETFVVVPMHGEDEGSLEFARYADLVAEELAEEGYAPAANEQAATMIVRLGYDVDEGRDRLVASPALSGYYGASPYYGRRHYSPFYRSRYYSPYYRSRYRRFSPYYARRYYGPRSAFYLGWGDPFWYDPFGRGVRNYTEYHSTLDLDIRRAADNQAIFEGSARARSRTDELGTLVPNLIEAMFTDFPGRNGETVKITVKPEDEDKELRR